MTFLGAGMLLLYASALIGIYVSGWAIGRRTRATIEREFHSHYAELFRQTRQRELDNQSMDALVRTFGDGTANG